MRGARRETSAVALARSEGRDHREVDFRALLLEALERLRELGIRLPCSGSVFLKPNVVIGVKATTGITTDPRLVAELISLLKESGVREVHVGDSSAGFQNASVARMRKSLIGFEDIAHGG